MMQRNDNPPWQHGHFLGLKPRRFRRWYEIVLLNPLLGHVLALLIVVVLPFILAYGYWTTPEDYNQSATMVTLALAYGITILLSRGLAMYPTGSLISYQMTVAATVIGLVILTIITLRLDYARKPLFIGFMALLCVQLLRFAIKHRFRYTKIALVPGGDIRKPRKPYPSTHFYILEAPDDDRRFDALVVDMNSEHSDDWIRFIARHSARGTPVLGNKHINECMDGCVDLDKLSDSDLVTMQPSPLYLLGKRITDLAGTLLLMPIALPLMVIVAIAIYISSRGPVLFIQRRVGVGNRAFNMIKFRSMRRPKNGHHKPRFADADEHRITLVGRIIRRSRLDELPQLFNVLKGEMSLIGPRPEQPAFAEAFEKEIPYYSYRHIVKPGITGWAQVQNGYASGLDDTYEKVEHDFFYIKHLGFGLDTLIVLKTLKIILTGFGAR